MFPVVNKVRLLKKEGKTEEAQKIVDNMSDPEYSAYKSLKKQLGID